MTIDFGLARDLISKLEVWTNKLAEPLLPPVENSTLQRLEFRQEIPQAVMIGKCIRAVSGINAAIVLADLGYVVECAAITRMVSDFCTEVVAIGKALQVRDDIPAPVQDLVKQYFAPKPRTPKQYMKTPRRRYPSRKQLMEVEKRWAAQMAVIDDAQARSAQRFINSSSDGYMHGAYETTMELYDRQLGRFRMRGVRDPSQHREYVEWVSLKLHEVVCALEITAAMTGHEEVWTAVRDARHALDKAEWSQVVR